MEFITPEQALAEIRATATRSVPFCINLAAIDGILARVQPATPVEDYQVEPAPYRDTCLSVDAIDCPGCVICGKTA